LTELLLDINQIFTSAILIVAFSLLAFVMRNWRDHVARVFCLLLASVVVVLAGKVLLGQARAPRTVEFLVRAQWLGIAFVPATYLHFSDELLRFTGHRSRLRSGAVWASYLAGVAFFSLALVTNLIVHDGIRRGALTQFAAGPIFPLFTAYFLATTIGGLVNIHRARRRSLALSLRRRMAYLSITFLAPALGVLPYLIVATTARSIASNVVLTLSTLATLGVGAMIVVMTYSVAFYGMLMPDRLIKQSFLRYILYGPTVGITVVTCMLLVAPLADTLALPRDTVLIFGVMIMTVLMPMIIARIKPTLDMLVYRQDREEVAWLRELERQAFTRNDLRHLLENTLIAVCGRLGVETGFVAASGENGLVVQASCGPRREIKRFLAQHPLERLAQELQQPTPHQRGSTPAQSAFLVRDGFCLLPLHSGSAEVLGVVGVEASDSAFDDGARQLISMLAHQMELALANIELQRGIYASLRTLAPEMASLQRLTSELDNTTAASAPALLESDVALEPDFDTLVKDALSHYWGGPKLSDSPLLRLRSVRQLLQGQGGSPTRALQAVLRQAIENLRPSDQLDPTAQEWLLYNILDLRFLQGLRIREIADKLAMSESDFYRKQRVAVEEVARQLALMEESNR
jgi:hypothetical protein